ncbi:MAG: amidase [Acidimicrobiaceae bacterium]|nr:amidase [Acidimicrobiaceae bacterium]
MTGRTDSLAGRSFDDAERALHGLELPFPRLAPPLDLRVAEPPGPRPRDSAARSAVAHPLRQKWVDAGRVAPTPVLAKGPTLTEALVQLAEGRTTTRDLVEAALVVAASTTALGTVVAIDEQAVREEADRLDGERAAGRRRGPLHGIPVTVKDVIDVCGLPTRAGSLAYEDEAPGDSVAVARLRAAGALVLAKVATHEFALGVTTPQCRNPHDPTRIAGGSSGGSAIAVATGVGLASLGTDTRASLRVPAHCCGVVGFKPTFGRVPTAGIVPLSWTIDHIGPITRTVEDAAVLLDVLAGTSFLDASGMPKASGVAVGIVPAVFDDADPDVAAVCESALAVLERLGCQIIELAGPTIEDLEISNALGLLISRSEASAFHRSLGTDLDRCIPEVRDQLVAGLTISAADYLDAQRQRLILSKRTLASFLDCDVVVTPTAPVVAPPHADYERYLLRLSRNTIVWSLIGAPAVSMPCGVGAGGLPVGLQLAAPPGREQDLVTIGTALERMIERAP